MGTAGMAPGLIMPDPDDGASDSKGKDNDGISVKDGESHLPSRFALLVDWLVI